MKYARTTPVYCTSMADCFLYRALARSSTSDNTVRSALATTGVGEPPRGTGAAHPWLWPVADAQPPSHDRPAAHRRPTRALLPAHHSGDARPGGVLRTSTSTSASCASSHAASAISHAVFVPAYSRRPPSPPALSYDSLCKQQSALPLLLLPPASRINRHRFFRPPK